MPECHIGPERKACATHTIKSSFSDRPKFPQNHRSHSIMGWFWADSPSTTRAPARSVAVDSSSSNNSRCPVDHSKWSSSSCPHHSGSANALNPRNNMPNLPNEPLHATPGASSLPTAREISSIPMNSEGERWQYPSPQQMLNAMTRKGYDGTSPEDVPAMVAVHNWLNEGSWEEILKWERKYFPYFFSVVLANPVIMFDHI